MTGVAKDGLAFATGLKSGEKRQPVATLYAIRFRGYVAQFTRQDVRRWRPNRMWFLFQSLIIFAVVASNIHRQWTPNGYPRKPDRRWAGVRVERRTERALETH
jgi:hypothetical protein